MDNTRIVYFGTPEFAQSILKALIDEKYNIVGVVSQPDRPVGRKHILTPTPTHETASAHGIPCIQPEKLSEAKEEIFALEPELIITCAYGQFVPVSILNYPKYGCINIHPSLLPKYRGGAPIQHVIMHGDSQTGVSIMEMVKEMDAGRVFAQCTVDIDEDETMSQLSEKLNQASIDLLLQMLPKYIRGELVGTEQNENAVVIAKTISKEEEQVHFQKETLEEAYNHIRALIEWPAAYGLLEGKRIKFYKARKEFRSIEDKPGTVLGFDDHALQIACTGGILKIYELQIEGKKRMDADAFKNGYAEEVIGKVFD